MTNRAKGLAWGAFVLLGLVTAALSVPIQLAYAASAIAVLGLPHGASDLALVPRTRRKEFLAAYIFCIGLIVIWWKIAPFSALVAFLFVSAIHFGLDDAPASRPLERVSRGVLMVAGPALLHHADLTHLFVTVIGEPEGAAALATVMTTLAVVATAMLPAILLGCRRRNDRRGAVCLMVGVSALLSLPPLVGFAIEFTFLHARIQLGERMTNLGCETIGSYLLITAPILVGAVAVLGLVAFLFANRSAPGAPTLFAGIAALAIPHMLVTPFWTMRLRSRGAEQPSIWAI